MADTDWQAVKVAYVTGRMSYRALAGQYGISESTLEKRARKEGWAQERRKYGGKVVAKAQARAQAEDVKRLSRLQSAGTKMCNQLEKLMKNASKELYTHVALEGSGKGRTHLIEKKLSVVDDKKLVNITRAIDTMSRAMRNLYDIQTAAEKAQTEAARANAEAARARARETEDKGVEAVEITFGDEKLEEYVE